MRRCAIRTLAFAVALALAGCVNLEPTANEVRPFALGPGEALQMSEARGPTVYVERPDLPGYAQGDRMIFREEGGAFETIDGARWAEPMGEGVARALGEWIARVSDRRLAGYYPWPSGDKEATSVRIRFLQLIATRGGAVHVAASWRVKKPDGATGEGEYASREIRWTPENPETLVAALNEAFRELATAIQTDLPE